jgi:hypothetical protein
LKNTAQPLETFVDFVQKLLFESQTSNKTLVRCSIIYRLFNERCRYSSLDI